MSLGFARELIGELADDCIVLRIARRNRSLNGHVSLNEHAGIAGGTLDFSFTSLLQGFSHGCTKRRE